VPDWPHPNRLHLVLFVVSALLLAAAVVILFTSGSASRHAQVGPTGFAGAVRPQIPPQDFRLRDEEGRVVRLSDFRGRVVVLTFLYSTCRDTCPVMAQQIRAALADLDVRPAALAVSVDPANDTPARARTFLARQHLTGRMRFLLGAERQLAPVWRAYGIAPQRHGRDHSAYVVVIDASGRQRVGFPADHLTPEALAHDVRVLARAV
jgi:protein SCO1/2